MSIHHVATARDLVSSAWSRTMARARVGYRVPASSPQVVHLAELLVAAERSGLPPVSLRDLVEELGGAGERGTIMHPRLWSMGSGSTAEMASLATIVAVVAPRTTLEFGTFNGFSTWHLWANTAGRVVTVDLPSEVQVAGSSDVGLQTEKSREFLPDSERITLIEIDSREWTCDLTGVDLCFIDAGHSYECVRNDTELALEALAPGGVIIWHDSAWTRDAYGVNAYLRELRAGGRDIRRVDPSPTDYSGLAIWRLAPADAAPVVA